jgi:UDP-N-acetylmuramate dehydrogenase
MDHESKLRAILGKELQSDEPMSRHTTLRVGGPARWFWKAFDVELLAETMALCHGDSIPYLFVGHGSNLLMSDAGFDGVVILNRCKSTRIGEITYSDSGVSLGSLYSQTARAGYSGLEWGVGIPGTIGGALVSNAGAYRGNIGPLVRSVRVIHDGVDKTVDAEWMEFAYRCSRLRRDPPERIVILGCTLALTYEGAPDAIQERARQFQQQRRSKQPFAPSAGSFFKNVNDRELAQSLPALPDTLKALGVVPAGYLIEAAGLKGTIVGGAQASEKHANFLINATGTATAADFHHLAKKVKAAVRNRFGVTLEEEVLYAGDWSAVVPGEPSADGKGAFES